jgi:N-acetylmuramoyl-L-alanine amidase
MHGPPYTVVIDPGHGPNNSGAGNGTYGLVERHVNLDVSLRLAPMLTAAGYNVILTRYGDYNLSHVAADTAIERRDEIQARVDLANQSNADILVSVHFNGSSAYHIRGTEVYYNPDRSYGHFNYARYVGPAMTRSTGVSKTTPAWAATREIRIHGSWGPTKTSDPV